jgi:membrane-associated protease RseP (regulator of RpoE activity)
MKTITTRRFLIPATLAVALGATGMGLAAPSDTRNPQAPQAGQTAPMRKGRLGIVALPISEELRAKLGAARDRGVLVDRVQPDSPASKAGVHVGDVIASVDGKPVQDSSDIVEAMSSRKKGERITMSVVRDGRPLDLNATLESDAAPMPRGTFGGGMGGNGDFQMPDMGNGEWHWLRPLPDANQGNSPEMQKQLDDTNKRLDELEQRLDKLEQH